MSLLIPVLDISVKNISIFNIYLRVATKSTFVRSQ